MIRLMKIIRYMIASAESKLGMHLSSNAMNHPFSYIRRPLELISC